MLWGTDAYCWMPCSAPFQPGDKVKVKNGPMSGFPALVSAMRPHQRIEILLRMLGGLQRVELAATDLKLLPG